MPTGRDDVRSWQINDILKTPATAATLLVALVALAGSISGPVVTYLLGAKQAETAAAQAAAANKSAELRCSRHKPR